MPVILRLLQPDAVGQVQYLAPCEARRLRQQLHRRGDRPPRPPRQLGAVSVGMRQPCASTGHWGCYLTNAACMQPTCGILAADLVDGRALPIPPVVSKGESFLLLECRNEDNDDKNRQ